MSRRGALCRIVPASWMTVALILFHLSRPALAVQEAHSPDVDIRIDAEPRIAEVGDPIRITLEILRPKDYQVQLPEIGKQVGEFTVLALSPGPTIEDARGPNSALSSEKPPETPGRELYQARVVAAIYRTGDFKFPPLQIVLRHPDGRETSASSPGIEIKIRSILEENDLELKALKKQAEIPEPSHWPFWAGIVLALALLSALGWWWWKRRTRPALAVEPQQQLDPLAAAEAELRDLLSRDLLRQGHVKPFYVSLAEIVKKMLEAGYGIQTLEKTTAEILEEMGSGSYRTAGGTGHRDDAQQRELIASLLTSCDLVKFARYLPSRSEADSAIEQTFRLLDVCRRLRPSPTTDSRASMEGAA